MSTRANIMVFDCGQLVAMFYKHHDGYDLSEDIVNLCNGTPLPETYERVDEDFNVLLNTDIEYMYLINLDRKDYTKIQVKAIKHFDVLLNTDIEYLYLVHLDRKDYTKIQVKAIKHFDANTDEQEVEVE